MGLLATLQSNFQHVLLYESPELQLKTRQHIPHEMLTAAAQQELTKAKTADQDCRLGIEDFLVLQLLQWFKQDFFSWVDCLPCSGCGGRTQNAGSLSPSTDDVRWGGKRVENHFCATCDLSTRFPRYNHPEKLLETRRGRCGEWANCFTLCCRALGLDARYVWDSTDHVWTEVYSEAQQRWLHCDSCENVCDKPLLYEVGWGKKLAYVMAFSKEQVVDVTWRYSRKHAEVLSRRTSVREAWLVHAINGLNSNRQRYLGAERKKQLSERLIVELVEFLSPKEVKAGELGGRSSGSLAWRIARGETRTGDPTLGKTGFVFMPNEDEKRNHLVHVRYSASKDQYCRVSRSSEVTRGWDQCIWKKDAVFRKVETDWQMVYLAREEASATGRISWKFDFSPAGMKVQSVSIMASCKSFHSGRVCWHVDAGKTRAEFFGNGVMYPLLALNGCSEFTITAELSGGEGETSWQHAQLFRQSLSEDVVSFEIIVQLQDA
ncbi:peptide-N(4)-(N-acetyl-beta-glucosaminyl)asparagine amidase isoform 1-T1 [Synchiropus picturatus]